MLSGREPTSQGTRRLVFDHPESPDLLIKVVKPGLADAVGQPRRRRRFKVKRREGIYAYFARELDEYVALRASRSDRRYGLPIGAVYGLVETDLGLGLLVEKIEGASGGLAPTLRDLLEARSFDGEKGRLLAAFFEALDENHVVLYELTPENIALQDDGERPRRFVCIDGIGSRTLLPVEQWSRRANTWKIRRLQRDLLLRLQQEYRWAAAYLVPEDSDRPPGPAASSRRRAGGRGRLSGKGSAPEGPAG